MGLPASVSTITVKGTYVGFDGVAPASGKVTFSPPPNVFLKVTDVDVIVVPKSISTTLDASGAFSVVLPVSDDADVVPSFTYSVTEELVLGTGTIKRTFNVEIPHTLTSPVDLSDLAPVGQTTVGTTALTKTVADLLYAPLGSGGGGGGGGGGPITADQITDAGATGIDVIRAATAAAARSAIGAGTSSLALGLTSSTALHGDYQPSSADISDSTSTGRALLTAGSAAAARSAIGAGTSSLALGTTSTTAKAGDWRPVSTDVTDSTTTGRALLTAVSTSAARTAIGAGTASTKADVGLPLVDNTSDDLKPLGTTQRSAVSDLIVSNVQVNPSTMTSSVNPSTGVITLGVQAQAVDLSSLTDVDVSGAVQGNQLTKLGTGGWGPLGIPTVALPVGSTPPTVRPLLVNWYTSSAPPIRHTLGAGTNIGDSVTAALEGMTLDTTNKATYAAAVSVPTAQGKVAQFTPAGSLRYLADTGLTYGTLYVRWFFYIDSITGGLNICEARTTSAAICALQMQADRTIQVKNVATTVFTTTTAFALSTWYRVDGKIGTSSQQWKFYTGNSGTVLEDTAARGAGSGTPDTFRIGQTVSANSAGVFRAAALDLSDQSLSVPWS